VIGQHSPVAVEFAVERISDPAGRNLLSGGFPAVDLPLTFAGGAVLLLQRGGSFDG